MGISVLTVTYDGETVQNIDRVLASMFHQTRPADQIVMVLDGPVRQEFRDVLDQWGTKLPLEIIEQPKAGVSAGRNLALAHCTHNFVICCDSDDINLPERFETQAHLLETTGAAVVSAPIREFTSDKSIDRIRDVPKGRITNTRIGTFFRNPINANSAAFRLDAVREVGGYPSGRMEDYLLWIMLLKNGHTLYNGAEIVLHAAVDGLGARRVGADYRAAEWKLFKTNAGRVYGAGALPAALCYIMRAPLRLKFMAPTLAMLYSKFLRKRRIAK
ncbi:MAG: glycosyltransferase [Planktomarina sp.]